MKNDPSHAVLRETPTSSATRRAPAAATTRRCKLWLRMLACTTQIEAEIRRRLRERFGISLARFDYMAQLYRYEDGLKMRDLSRYLMVTGGNVTGLTDDLERDGTGRAREQPGRPARLDRAPHRRRAGAASRPWPREHERWILELFSGLDAATVRQLHAAARPTARAPGAEATTPPPRTRSA